MMSKVSRKDIAEIVGRPYTIELEYGDTAEDGVVARVAEWWGCMTAASTRADALRRIEDAMHDWVEARLAAGLDIPEPMQQFGGKVLVTMPRSLHRDIAHRSDAEGVSMNQWISTTLARAVGRDAHDALSDQLVRYRARTTPRKR